jgi:hypothetical protein
MRKTPFSHRRMMHEPWYRQMVSEDSTAIYEALAREEMLAAKRLIGAGWSPQDAWRLASEAAEHVGAGWPGWQRVDRVREAFA